MSAPMEGQDLVLAAMREPGFYPWSVVGAVQEIHTHISEVFLAGDYVCKVKKPMNFGFLDFTSLEKRAHFCQREVELNRRLSVDVYDRVETIRQSPDGLVLGGDESWPVVEWCVVMHRLDDSRFLHNMLSSDPDSVAALIPDALQKLDRSYRAQNPGDDVRALGSVEKVGFNLIENYDQTQAACDDLWPKRTWEWARTTVENRLQDLGPLIEARAAKWVVEAHGDLHTQHLWFDASDEAQFVDCIEFNERFRCIDVLSDLAFLYMDMVSAGHARLAAIVGNHALTLRDDSEDGKQVERLFSLYASYRAMVRAKVSSFLCGDTQAPQSTRDKARKDAAHYFALHCRFLIFGSGRRLLLLSGPAASGKSTLARAFMRTAGIPRVSSDHTRKQLFGVTGPTKDKELKKKMYTAEVSEKVYNTLIEDAKNRLDAQGMATIDATNLTKEQRQPFVDMTDARSCCLTIVNLSVSEDTVRQRLARRAKSDTAESDADLDIWMQQKDRFVPDQDAIVVHADADDWDWHAMGFLADQLQGKT